MRHLILALLITASANLAGAQSPEARIAGDVIFLGEQHDNPAHHARQAELVSQLNPKALVFEMLTAEHAELVTPELRPDAEALGAALAWEGRGWPDFNWYHPIFTAAPQARIFGAAVPRDQVRGLMAGDVAQVFGEDAARFGLTAPLPVQQQTDREAMQLAAHCDALPEEMLPVMVSIQRLRDAALARAALEAFDATGGPVVVITGNGHARKDWGAPVALALAAPDLQVSALGQGETGTSGPSGTFDLVELSAPVQRDDPCEAFLKSRGD